MPSLLRLTAVALSVWMLAETSFAQEPKKPAIPHAQDKPPNEPRDPQTAAKMMTVPEGFSVATASGLGLSIVRALVTSDLRGTIEMFDPPDGTPGTIVELRIPIDLAP